MNRILIYLLLLTALVPVNSGCNRGGSGEKGGGKEPLRGKITISGAFALYPLAVRWAEEYKKLHPHITINISAGGAGKGMADVLSRMVDLAMFSKEISPEETAKGAFGIPVAKDAVIPTINQRNPVLKELKTVGFTRQKFYDVFISGKLKTWGEATGTSSREEILVFTRSDACGAADMWAKYLGNKTQEDLLGIGVNGDPGVGDAIRKNTDAIGYNNLNFIYDIQTRHQYAGLEVIPIDLDNSGRIDSSENFYGSLDEVRKAIGDGRYPSPPARDLYFVTAGKPQNELVKGFLEWILTEGQHFVGEAGYISLPPEKIEAALKSIQ